MAYGIKVWSANGAVQLDSTDTNQILYQEFASGTSSAATGASSGDFRQITQAVTDFTPAECLVFIRPTGTVTGVKAYVMPGSNGFSIFQIRIQVFTGMYLKELLACPPLQDMDLLYTLTQYQEDLS